MVESRAACSYSFTRVRRSSSRKKTLMNWGRRESVSASGRDRADGDGEDDSAGRLGWGKRGKKSEGGTSLMRAHGRGRRQRGAHRSTADWWRCATVGGGARAKERERRATGDRMECWRGQADQVEARLVAGVHVDSNVRTEAGGGRGRSRAGASAAVTVADRWALKNFSISEFGWFSN